MFHMRVILLLSCVLSINLLFSIPARAEEDLLQLVEKKQVALTQKEEALKQEAERLKALKRDVDERIEKYAELLARIEKALDRVEEAEKDNMKHLVSTYEAMPPEEAASRLSLLHEATAVKIISAMKSRKAGVVMGLIEPEKAASLTKHMAVKKFPPR
jgi:flagellar motility protein MotE (MotC chaperone)